MPDPSEAQYQHKRKGQERRRFGLSMIRNYADYSGPERRSGIDRRQKEKLGVIHAMQN